MERERGGSGVVHPRCIERQTDVSTDTLAHDTVRPNSTQVFSGDMGYYQVVNTHSNTDKMAIEQFQKLGGENQSLKSSFDTVNRLY